MIVSFSSNFVFYDYISVLISSKSGILLTLSASYRLLRNTTKYLDKENLGSEQGLVGGMMNKTGFKAKTDQIEIRVFGIETRTQSLT